MVFEQVEQAWRELPISVRDRVHLASLPTADVQENAAIVNALQRHASIVVQKSLEEGFGLTVTEAMWKGRPVLASAVGGICDQIIHGETGLLLEDPQDRDLFAAELGNLIEDRERAMRLGEAGAARGEGVHDLLDAHPIGVRPLDLFELLIGPARDFRFPISASLSSW